MNELDRADRAAALHRRILAKPALTRLYLEIYHRYAECLSRCAGDGLVVEIGAGAGLVKQVVPDITTTDIIPYRTIDLAIDATRMPFSDGSVRAICMLNTLHHIPDVARFFDEARRCLAPGGRVLIVDQYPGWISHWVLKYLHHEPYDPGAVEWSFGTTGPLCGANGALCWIVFYRDRTVFEQRYPELRIVKTTPHTPLRYWLAGGLKAWCLLPARAFGMASHLDHWLARSWPGLSSFVDVELVRR